MNDIGKKAKELWTEIPDKFEDIKLDAFVVMPNHVHGIIIIGNYWEYVRRVVIDADAMNRVPTMKMESEKGGELPVKIIPCYQKIHCRKSFGGIKDDVHLKSGRCKIRNVSDGILDITTR